MLKDLIITILPEIIHLIDIFAICIIMIGVFRAFGQYILAIVNKKHYSIKIELANSLALGLGFKMGSEILKTILIQEMSEIYMLGALILLHGILTLLIQYEIKHESNIKS